MAVSSAAVGILFYAVLAAIYRRGARRAFWTGMAVVGWGYFALVSLSYWSSNSDLPLATTWFLDCIDEIRPRPAPEFQLASVPKMAIHALNSGANRVEFQVYTESNPPPPNVPPNALMPTMIDTDDDDSEDFRLIGQCLCTLATGLLGGFVARRLYEAEAAAGGTR